MEAQRGQFFCTWIFQCHAAGCCTLCGVSVQATEVCAGRTTGHVRRMIVHDEHPCVNNNNNYDSNSITKLISQLLNYANLFLGMNVCSSRLRAHSGRSLIADFRSCVSVR